MSDSPEYTAGPVPPDFDRRVPTKPERDPRSKILGAALDAEQSYAEYHNPRELLARLDAADPLRQAWPGAARAWARPEALREQVEEQIAGNQRLRGHLSEPAPQDSPGPSKEKVERQRLKWQSAYVEAERRLGELERTNRALVAAKEKAERERDGLRNEVGHLLEVAPYCRTCENVAHECCCRDMGKVPDHVNYPLPTITGEEIRAVETALGCFSPSAPQRRYLRTLADKLENARKEGDDDQA